ncbi:MAG: S8 family serine peptidase [Bacteriovoracaceae bacterium]|jgi:cell wall-associated protease|nr:S8 family serine peptidase [Bacteriovoracaceae bacterium]
MKLISLFMCMLVSITAQSATVVIIDSGTDMLHKDIAPVAWVNPGEIAANDRDEDRNGYQDDIHGWNFAESNNKVIDYSYLGTLTFDIRKFFGIQTKYMLGTATQEEIDWMKNSVKDPEFLKQLQIYGNFMHGTHVAGIAAKNVADSKIMAVKLIPTEVKLPFSMYRVEDKGLGLTLIKQGLKLLAKQQTKLMIEIGEYINNHKVNIANGSFGTGYKQASMIVTALFQAILKREPTDAELKEVTLIFLNTLIKEGEHFTNAAQETLFVFAAGNDGMNNDEFPTSPTNINTPNVISVAATQGRTSLAVFSNYGVKQVDVAAPGVGIESTVPGNNYLKVSGTSQAAPYVANVAALIKEGNKSLAPSDIKRILMESVDFRTYLRTKVKSKGLVNTSRAVLAAELSNSMSIKDALTRARSTVQDVNKQIDEDLAKSLIERRLPVGMIQSLPSMFKL